MKVDSNYQHLSQSYWDGELVMEELGNLYFTNIDLKTKTRYSRSDYQIINSDFMYATICKKTINKAYVDKLLENKYITLDGGDFKNPEYYSEL